jgi:hypothetical protein
MASIVCWRGSRKSGRKFVIGSTETTPAFLILGAVRALEKKLAAAVFACGPRVRSR